jgi:hypothetical protein
MWLVSRGTILPHKSASVPEFSDVILEWRIQGKPLIRNGWSVKGQDYYPETGM